MFKFELQVETPEELARWVLALREHGLLGARTIALDGMSITELAKAETPKETTTTKAVSSLAVKPQPAPAQAQQPAMKVHPGPFTESGRPVDEAGVVELSKDLKAFGYAAIVKAIGVEADALKRLYRAHRANDEAALAEFKARAVSAAEPSGDDPPAKAAPPAAAAPALKGKKRQPPVAADESIDDAPPAKVARSEDARPAGKTPVVARAVPAKADADGPKVVARAPIKAKGASPNTLGRVTPDSIPGGGDVDDDDDEVDVSEGADDEEPSRAHANQEVDEGDEGVETEEGEEDEVEEAAPAGPPIPTVDKKKIPTEIKTADRMRDIVSAIQRNHNATKAEDVYRWMKAYEPFVPKIQAQLESEDSSERMVTRIGNIIIANRGGK